MSKDEKDTDIILGLNFAPSWARSSPDANLQRLKKNDRFESGEGDDFQRRGRDRKGGGNDRRPPRRDFDDRPPRDSDRRPNRDPERRGPRPDMPRPESRGAVVDFSQPARPSAATPRPQFRDDRRRPNDGFRPNDNYRQRDHEPYQQQLPALPLDIRVLPEQKALGAVIRRIQTSHRAFPLRDIAWLFLDNPNSCLIRIEPLKDQQIPLFQCKVCGYPALTEEEVRAHLVNRHLDDFFDSEEADCEPPSGVFNCVARCTLSGELLGPPNHHSFAAKVQEMLRTRYANMTEEAYRSRVEMVRDPEVIEQWRQQCTKKKVYRRKGVAVHEEQTPTPEAAVEGGEEAPAEAVTEPPSKAPVLTREVAELVFMREVVPVQLASVRNLICTAGVATQTSSRQLAMILRDMLARERRFPASLFFALRGAFRHRKLYLFRVNDPRGIDFVMLKTPTVLDTTHTVQILQDILTHVAAHPACTKAELVTVLGGTEEAKRKEVLIQLAWLVERGHVIEFYNDVLSIPCEYPTFKLLPGEKGYQGGARPSAPSQAPAASTAEVPAVENLPPENAEELVAVVEEPAVEAEPLAEVEEPVTEAEPTPPEVAEEPVVSAEEAVASLEEPKKAEPPVQAEASAVPTEATEETPPASE